MKSEQYDQARYRFSWNGRNEEGDLVSSGVYIIVLQAMGTTDIKKLAVVRRK